MIFFNVAEEDPDLLRRRVRGAAVSLVACVALAAGACEAASPPRDAAVHLAVLSRFGYADGTTVVVDHTVPSRADAPLTSELPAELRDSFLASNAVPRPLGRRAFAPARVRFAAADSVRELEGRGGAGYWGAFRERFPGAPGVVELSGVGYSADGMRAAVYLRYACGTRCGGGWLAELRREEDGWRVERSRMLWIS